MAGRADTSGVSICTALRLRKAARRVSLIYDRHLEPHELTITQFGLLAQVDRFDGVGIGELADKLIMDPTTLTRNLRPLQQRKLLVLAPDPNDRRSRCLHLTEAGRTALAEARPAWAQAQRQIDAAFGAGDTAKLRDTLDRFLERLA